jgi:hypothetical protein
MESSTPNGDYPFFRKEFFNGIGETQTLRPAVHGDFFAEPERTARTNGVSHAIAAQIFVLCDCCGVGRGARDRPDTGVCRRRDRHNRDGLRS